MKKSLGFIVLVSLLLLVAACQPKTAPEKEIIVTGEVDTTADLDGEAFAEVDDIDLTELDELDNLEAELDDLENLDFE